jgi:hypothetical protein
MTQLPMTLEAKDILNHMRHNAEALNRLLLAHEEVTLDPERRAHYNDLLDEIAARELRHTTRINELLVRAHLDRRIQPAERRHQGPDRRKPPAVA